MAHFEQFERHLLDEILVFANLIQIPAVILTGGVAWLVCRPIRRWVTSWVERVPEHHHLDWIVSHRSWVTDRLVPLITPMAWAIGLWISVAVAERAGWPHAVTQTAVSLLLAWLVIRLAAALVPYAALARLIAVLAWLVAALNIVHLLGPTLDLLDSVAVVVGGLRVSILTVVKGVLSLAMLLWAATVASNLFERRITRVSEITPRARVLLGKLIKATLVTLAVVLSLTSIGVDLTTFALFTGALGVGVGLGLQRTVSNLFSGIVLLLDKSIKPGDVIEVGGTYGWVSSLGARYVSVETRDGTEFLIPNEDIITHQVVNWSHKSDRVRLKVPVRVPSRFRSRPGARPDARGGELPGARPGGAGAQRADHGLRRDRDRARAAVLDRGRAERRAQRQEPGPLRDLAFVSAGRHSHSVPQAGALCAL